MTHKTQKKGRKESESSVGEQTASSHDCSMPHARIQRCTELRLKQSKIQKNNYEQNITVVSIQRANDTTRDVMAKKET